jgi:transcriptional regulator with XRE-family HTH domain
VDDVPGGGAVPGGEAAPEVDVVPRGEAVASANAGLATAMDLGAMLRVLRREADLSQRELADLAGLPQSTLSRIEAGTAWDPKFRTIERLVRAAGAALAVDKVDVDVRAVGRVDDEPRDAAGRRYPSHLDLREVNDAGDWAAAWWTHWVRSPRDLWPVPVPDFTFDLRRSRRDRRRFREVVVHGVRVCRVEVGSAVDEWRWVAKTAEGALVGELRAFVRDVNPEANGHLKRGVMPPREVVLVGVVVAPPLRRMGIGRRLVEALAVEMDSAGVCVARCFTEEFGAGMFLAKCGFRTEAVRRMDLVLTRSEGRTALFRQR